MSIPWYALMWVPGTLLGVSLGLLGGFIGVRASRGRLRPRAVRLMMLMMAVAALFVAIGVTALAAGQPRGVWYSLLLPGLTGLASLGANLPGVIKRVREQSRVSS